MTKRRKAVYLGVISALFLLIVGWYASAYVQAARKVHTTFDGARAYADVQAQVAFGPRIPGSPAHAHTVDWIRQQLEDAGWHVEIQQSQSMGHPIQNIRAWRSDAAPEYVIGAHYDSRINATNDPDPAKRSQPVPGADDGASGVAVLLELARTLPQDSPAVWLVFFDAEDNGGLPGWDWLLGSRAFVAGMQAHPRGMILLDMVGQADLSIPIEGNSDKELRTAIWNKAASLGYGSTFIPRVKYNIEDDHLPFIEAGIPAVDIIDIDYPYWHTTSDLPEHVSARSLQVVGDVVSGWLNDQAGQ